MGLRVAADDVAALEQRTEGWIAGLQLAAISMRGHDDAAGFVRSFTGSHRFVLDYLVEEVLRQQSSEVQTFLLRTSLLSRMCGPLCDAVLQSAPGIRTGHARIARNANLFIVPLDNERRWYRYHHLFGELLRQRHAMAGDLNALRIRASQWHEDNGLDIEAFQYAAAANDIDRAERLIEGTAIPLHLRGAVSAIVNWLATLPVETLNARPSLWWRYGSLMLVIGQTSGVEEKLNAAENALQRNRPGVAPLDPAQTILIGRVATARSVLALTRYDVAGMHDHAKRALAALAPDMLSTRATAYWTLGMSHAMRGDRVAARQSFSEGIALGQRAGDAFTTMLAAIGLASVLEGDLDLHRAATVYAEALQLAGDQPLQIVNEAYLGLARLHYAWNDLDTAARFAEKSYEYARQYERAIDRYVLSEILAARIQLARGESTAAAASLAQTSQTVRQKNFVLRAPDVAAAQVLALLHAGDIDAAGALAATHDLPLSRARVRLAQGDATAALAILGPLRAHAESKGWRDERLKARVLESLAHQLQNDSDRALLALADAAALAEPGGDLRSFLDEGAPMAQLLREMAKRRIQPAFTARLLSEIDRAAPPENALRATSAAPQLIESLSPRELEILVLIAQGLTNHEIGERLFLALSTVKGHNQRIFEKLQVQRRTEAISRARELRLI